MKESNKAQKTRLQERFRIFIQAVSFAFHNGYVLGWIKGTPYSGSNKNFCMPGLNCYSCPGAIAACPIGALQSVLDSGKMKVSLYVLGFIGAVGMLCGRLICGWLCPFGAIQDLMYRIPLFRKVKNLPGHRYLRWLKYAVLILFVVLLPMVITGPAGNGQPWFCEWICPSGTLLGGIPLLIANKSLRAAAGLRFVWKLTVLLLILVGSVKFYRPFCKYLCPLGALYGSCNKLSLYRLKVDEEKCVACGACQRACGMDIPVWQRPNSIECIRCGKCMAACPTGAISSTWQDLLGKKSASAADAGVASVSAQSAGNTPDEKASPCAATGMAAEAAPDRGVPDGADVLPSRANRIGRILLSLLIGITCLVSFALWGSQLISGSLRGYGATFLTFILSYAGIIGTLCACVCCTVYACKLFSCRKRTERDADIRQLAKGLAVINVVCNLAVIPFLLMLACTLKGQSFGDTAAYLGQTALACGAFWLIPTLLMLCSVVFCREKRSRICR